MSQYPFALPAQTTLAIRGSTQVFPVGRVLCIGRNYPWPGAEVKAAAQMPSWFVKPAQTVVAASGALPYPRDTQEFCHEVELVVAIGKGGYCLNAQEVERECIWGYAVGLDMTRRELQREAKRVGDPWSPAKVFECAAPCSPIVPAANMGILRRSAIWLTVNGEHRQTADIADMLFPVAELVAMLSRSLCLLPGDLIFTGTPAGVGTLRPGDNIEAGIEGLGEIAMQVKECEHV
jgi:fumarylpyruvate hydrolase